MANAASDAASLAYQARKDGNLSLAREHYSNAASLYREQGDRLAYAHTIRHAADIHRQEGNSAPARSLYEEALEIYRSSFDTGVLDLANAVRPYALLLQHEGYPALALPLWQEAAHLYSSIRINDGVSECNTHIAELTAIVSSSE